MLAFPREPSNADEGAGEWSVDGAVEEGRVDEAAWANDDGDAAVSQSAERMLQPAGAGSAEIVEFPTSGTEKRRRLEDASGTQRTHQPDVEEGPPRPKYLASELLAEDLTPAEPLRRTLRWGAVILGIAGAIASAVSGGLSTASLTIAAVFAIAAAAGVAPLTPRQRGPILATFGVLGAAGAAWVGTASAVAGPSWMGIPLLTACVIVAVSALLFRGAHVVSRLARALVVVGIGALAGWLFLSGGIEATVVAAPAWQAFVFPVLRIGLVAVLLGAALTFLDPRGQGGAAIAAGGLLLWVTLFCGATLVLDLLPLRARAETITIGDPRWVALCAIPFFAALAGGGLCQVYAMVAGRLARRTP